MGMSEGRTLPKDLHGFLDPNDGVAISFWIISIAMVAATVFFLMESTAVAGHWSTSMNVGALVTLVAAVHYFYMREFWVQLHTSPILYRYIDWTITVPLQMIEFYLILSAVSKDISQASFWKLLFGTLVMLVAGYAGESHFVDPWLGFLVGMSGWCFILFEIFGGEAGKVAASLRKRTRMWCDPSAPCELLSRSAGASTLRVTSSVTSLAVSMTTR